MSAISKKRKRNSLRSPAKERFENDKLDQSLPFFFDIPLSSRILVDSLQTIKLMDSVMCDAHILGIDTETRPSVYNHSNKSKNKTALIQVCTRSERGNEMVFIVDLITIAKFGLLTELDNVLTPILADENVVKLGHGLVADVKELQRSYPCMTSVRTVENIIDTTKMYRKLRPNEKNSISLKKLTKIFLHLNLIKAQTCSDWEMRPLSESQLHYCACDALVLLRLYDAMTFDALDVFGDASFEDISCSIVCTDSVAASAAKTEADMNRPQHFIALGSTSDSIGSSSIESESDDTFSLCEH